MTLNGPGAARISSGGPLTAALRRPIQKKVAAMIGKPSFGLYVALAVAMLVPQHVPRYS